MSQFFMRPSSYLHLFSYFKPIKVLFLRLGGLFLFVFSFSKCLLFAIIRRTFKRTYTHILFHTNPDLNNPIGVSLLVGQGQVAKLLNPAYGRPLLTTP